MKIISENERKRECVEITPAKRNKKHSRTFHQTKVGGKWINNAELDDYHVSVRGGRNGNRRGNK